MIPIWLRRGCSIGWSVSIWTNTQFRFNRSSELVSKPPLNEIHFHDQIHGDQPYFEELRKTFACVDYITLISSCIAAVTGSTIDQLKGLSPIDQASIRNALRIPYDEQIFYFCCTHTRIRPAISAKVVEDYVRKRFENQYVSDLALKGRAERTEMANQAVQSIIDAKDHETMVQLCAIVRRVGECKLRSTTRQVWHSSRWKTNCRIWKRKCLEDWTRSKLFFLDAIRSTTMSRCETRATSYLHLISMLYRRFSCIWDITRNGIESTMGTWNGIFTSIAMDLIVMVTETPNHPTGHSVMQHCGTIDCTSLLNTSMSIARFIITVVVCQNQNWSVCSMPLRSQRPLSLNDERSNVCTEKRLRKRGNFFNSFLDKRQALGNGGWSKFWKKCVLSTIHACETIASALLSHTL